MPITASWQLPDPILNGAATDGGDRASAGFVKFVESRSDVSVVGCGYRDELPAGQPGSRLRGGGPRFPVEQRKRRLR